MMVVCLIGGTHDGVMWMMVKSMKTKGLECLFLIIKRSERRNKRRRGGHVRGRWCGILFSLFTFCTRP